MGADYSRVTHPCAALLRAEAPFTLDLHVLGLPPAFVLSQDQTLQFDSLFLQRRLLSAADIFFRDVPWNVFTSTSHNANASHNVSVSRSASPAVSFLGSHFCLFLSLLRFSNHRGLNFEPVNEKRLIRALGGTVKLFFQKKFIERILGRRQQLAPPNIPSFAISQS